jgi:membrane associated rhomboid family serine protease
MDNQYRPSNFQILPPVVKNLLIINGLMFLTTYIFDRFLHIDLTQKLGLYYWGSQYFQPYQIVTHMFMHGSIMHIGLNMFGLWMFGSTIENYWGSKRFLIYYMITGLGAAVTLLAFNYYSIHSLQIAMMEYTSHPTIDSFVEFTKNRVPDVFASSFNSLIHSWIGDPTNPHYIENSKSLVNEMLQIKMDTPTVGASGAIFGVLTAFGMLFPNTILLVFFIIPAKAKYAVIGYGLYELYYGIQNNPTDNVAHFAHLGGALFGFLMIQFFYKPNKNQFY